MLLTKLKQLLDRLPPSLRDNKKKLFVCLCFLILFRYGVPNLHYVMQYAHLFISRKFSDRRKRLLPGDASRLPYTVSLTNIDWWKHMNNACYLRYAELGRVDYFTRSGIHHALAKYDYGISFVAVNVRFRRQLTFGKRFIVETRAIRWSGATLIIEQKFVGAHDNFLHAIVYGKYVLVDRKNRGKRISGEELRGRRERGLLVIPWNASDFSEMVYPTKAENVRIDFTPTPSESGGLVDRREERSGILRQRAMRAAVASKASVVVDAVDDDQRTEEVGDRVVEEPVLESEETPDGSDFSNGSSAEDQKLSEEPTPRGPEPGFFEADDQEFGGEEQGDRVIQSTLSPGSQDERRRSLIVEQWRDLCECQRPLPRSVALWLVSLEQSSIESRRNLLTGV